MVCCECRVLLFSPWFVFKLDGWLDPLLRHHSETYDSSMVELFDITIVVTLDFVSSGRREIFVFHFFWFIPLIDGMYPWLARGKGKGKGKRHGITSKEKSGDDCLICLLLFFVSPGSCKTRGGLEGICYYRL